MNRYDVDVSRNLKYIAIALLIGISLLLAVSRYIGTTLAYLAFFDPNNDQPLMVLQSVSGGLIPQAPDGLALADPAPADPVRSANTEIDEWLAPHAARMVGQYRLVFMPEGRHDEKSQGLVLLKFEQASNVVRVLTDSDYPLAHPSALPWAAPSAAPSAIRRGEEWIIASYQVLAEPLPEVLVVWLANASDTDVINPLDLLADHSEIGDLIIWRGAPMMLQGRSWAHMLLMRFNNLSEATHWLTADETQTLRKIIGARTESFHISVYAHR